jgi:hypothetical protein
MRRHCSSKQKPSCRHAPSPASSGCSRMSGSKINSLLKMPQNYKIGSQTTAKRCEGWNKIRWGESSNSKISWRGRNATPTNSFPTFTAPCSPPRRRKSGLLWLSPRSMTTYFFSLTIWKITSLHSKTF